MKNKKQCTKKLELDVEVIADLEASERDTDAVKGGGVTLQCGGTGTRTGNT